MKQAASRGVILVTVLWTVALISALAMAASVTFRGFAGIVAIDRDRLTVDGLFTGGIEVAAGLIANAGDNPLADIETTVTLSSGSVHIRLEDEGGRIDIGQAPPDVLAALFRAIGAPNADAVARGIVHWRDSDVAAANVEAASQTGAAIASGSTTGAAGAAATRPSQTPAFADVRELLQIPGMRPEWVAAVAPLTTVFGNETINPLTAPAGVLAALPGVTRAQLASFLDMRRSSPGDLDKLTGLFGAAQAYLDAKPPQAVSVRLTARLADGYAADGEAVIVCLKGDRQPYRILAWKPLPSPSSL
jgi:general secretion pathway protein K